MDIDVPPTPSPDPDCSESGKLVRGLRACARRARNALKVSFLQDFLAVLGCSIPVLMTLLW